MSQGLDVGLTAHTYWVWKRACHGLGLEWERLSTSVPDPRSATAWRQEVVVERFHASILRRLAEKALAAAEPGGAGAVWVAAGGGQGHYLELDDLLRTLRAHREVTECQLLARTRDPDSDIGPEPVR